MSKKEKVLNALKEQSELNRKALEEQACIVAAAHRLHGIGVNYFRRDTMLAVAHGLATGRVVIIKRLAFDQIIVEY